MRIGQSIDIHPLKEGRDLILGGVKIPYEYGLDGHSDADVLVHTISECILGALVLGDLGSHFPDTDPRYRGISSILLLEEVKKKMFRHQYRIGNIDATILAEKPKMAPYIEQMRINIANALECSTEAISIKATRGEKLGFVGRKEGIVAMSVCLLEENK